MDGFGRILLRHFAAPQNVVGHEQAAFAKAWQGQAQGARIVFFVNIAENDVEFLFLF